MERKAKLGWSALRIIGLIYTPLGAVFLIAAGVIVFFAEDMMPLWLTFSLLGGVFFLLGVVFLAVEQRKKRKWMRCWRQDGSSGPRWRTACATTPYGSTAAIPISSSLSIPTAGEPGMCSKARA